MNTIAQSNIINQASLVDQLPCICIWKDKNLNFQGFNKEALKTFKLNNVEEVIGKTDSDLPWSAKASMFLAQDEFVLKGNTQFNIDHTIRSDGSETRILIKKAPLYSDLGKLVGLSGVGFHLTLENHQQFLGYLSQQPYTEFNSHLFTKKKKFIYGDIAFTHRQAQVISFLLRGYSAARIGDVLHLSKRTVEAYIEDIKDVLDCSTKSDIFKLAFKIGFIELMCYGLEN